MRTFIKRLFEPQDLAQQPAASRQVHWLLMTTSITMMIVSAFAFAALNTLTLLFFLMGLRLFVMTMYAQFQHKNPGMCRVLQGMNDLLRLAIVIGSLLYLINYFFF